MSDQPALSIVLPCYNEAAGLPALLDRFAAVCEDTRFELVLVDNGSTDQTRQLLPALLPRYPFARSVRVEKNQGYGHGILTGLEAATADVVAWSHADLQTDPADVFRAWRLYQKVACPKRTLVKGCRRGRRLSERALSWAMQCAATILLRTPLHEINAQPKLFHRDLLPLLKRPPVDLNFDLYVLYTAICRGWTCQSISVEFPPRTHGVSSWANSWRSRVRTILKSLRYVLTLAFNSSDTQPVPDPTRVDHRQTYHRAA